MKSNLHRFKRFRCFLNLETKVFSLLMFAFILTNSMSAQCAFNNDPFTGTDITGATLGSTTTLTTCIWQGEYYEVTLLPKHTYTFATCGDPDFDTQMTIFDPGDTSTPLAFNDDFCGLQSSVTITPLTNVIWIQINEFDCVSTGNTCMTLTATYDAESNSVCPFNNINFGTSDLTGSVVGDTETLTSCLFRGEYRAVNVNPGTTYDFYTCGDTDFDTQLNIFDPADTSAPIASNDDFCGLQSSITITPTVPVLWIQVTEYDCIADAAGLCMSLFADVIAMPPVNNVCANAIALGCANTLGTTVDASTEDAPAFCGTSHGTSPGVWYTLTGTGESITVSTCNAGTNYDTKLGVFSGTCGSLTCIDGNDDGASCALASLVSFDSDEGVTYYIYVSGFGGAEGDFELSVAYDPVCVTQTVTVVLDAAGNGSTTAAAVDNGSLDVCGSIASLSLSQSDFTCADVPGITTTLTVTDNDGNTTACDATVNVLDVTVPVPVCTPATVQLDAAGNANVSLAQVLASATDACGLQPGGTVTPQTFTCAEVGANNVTVSVVDVNGLTGTCTAVVTVEDNIAPTATNCVGSTQSANASCILPAFTTQVYSLDIEDNCGLMTVQELIQDENGTTLANNSFASTPSDSYTIFNIVTLPLGANTVTITLTDEEGNSDAGSTCTMTVTVEDTTPPTMLCQNTTVVLDNDGLGSITENDIDNGSFDNCSAVSLSLNISDFTCADVGTNPVVLTGTDAAGLSATCVGMVTVEDNTPAEIECRQPVSTVADPGACQRTNLTVLPPFVLYDNCGIEEGITITRSPAGDDFNVGVTVLDWTVTDSNGNISTCQSEVIIEDDQAPIIGPCNTEISEVAPYNCEAFVQVTSEVTDNCGIASVTGLGNFILAPGVYLHEVVATDVNGNTTVHVVSIEIHDPHAPEFSNCPTEPIVVETNAGGTAGYPLAFPTATDNCGIFALSNNIPEGGLPIGENTVIFTAEDNYGNESYCEVTVIVEEETDNIVSLHPSGTIAASLEANETSQIVTWNALNAQTSCDLCEETQLEGFRYVGTYWGHQYFIADEVSMTHEEAQIVAESYDAHLAVINDADENAYLVEALGEDVRSVWIGMEPEETNGVWSFVWENGDEMDFNALEVESIDEDTRVILTEEGTWEAATIEENKHFLIERPCVNYTQTGPVYEFEEDLEPVLLRSGDAWPEGEYNVTYTLTDMCGNELEVDFPVEVAPEVADFCTSVGHDNSVWISTVGFHEMQSQSESNEGYADFTDETVSMNIGDGVVFVYLAAGGNEEENMLYWRIFLDKNNDGDFFDAEEMIYETASKTAVTANLTLPMVALEESRMRVMVSRYGFAEPCGDTYVGEIEDYEVTFLLPEDPYNKPNPVNVFPNPADNYVNINLKQYLGQEVTVRIFDNLGKERLIHETGIVVTPELTLQLNDFVDGLYHISISSEGFRVKTFNLKVNKFYNWTPSSR